jgi:AcrR family transcriptional regulator
MPSTRRGERTRRQIIESSAAVFDTFGFHGATLTQLVAATGLTRGAFYFHFDAKDSLAQAIVREQADRWPELLAAVQREEPEPMRQLVRFAFASAALYQTDVVVRAASRLITEKVLINRELPETYPWWISSVHALLVEADARGDLRDTADLVATPVRRVPPPELSGESADGLQALAEYLVTSWVGSQQAAAASGNQDLSARVFAGWSMTISAVCTAPEPRDDLMALCMELAEPLRTDPGLLVARLLRPGDETESA